MKTNKVKDLFCDLCSLQFDKKYVYDVHMSLVHKNCSTDSPSSKIDETVVKRENKDTDVAFENIQNSKSKGNMNKHIDVIHEEKKPYQCSICEYRCTMKGKMNRHINSVHEGKKPHKCSICDHCFALKHQLKVHISAIHDGKKPNKCSICDRCFALKQQLKVHIDAIHDGKKPHKCVN